MDLSHLSYPTHSFHLRASRVRPGIATGGTSSSTTPLGVQSIAVDQNTGYVYWGEYSTDASKGTINVWRSTDDGATWTVFHAFDSTLDGGSGAGHIRHVHGVQWDPISERIWVTVGDSEDDAGIYRVNSGGTDLEAVVVNAASSTASGGA